MAQPLNVTKVVIEDDIPIKNRLRSAKKRAPSSSSTQETTTNKKIRKISPSNRSSSSSPQSTRSSSSSSPNTCRTSSRKGKKRERPKKKYQPARSRKKKPKTEAVNQNVKVQRHPPKPKKRSPKPKKRSPKPKKRSPKPKKHSPKPKKHSPKPKKHASKPKKRSPKPKKRSPKQKRQQKYTLSDIPDAPIFRPTTAEFQDPMGYIKRIEPEASKHGICVVVPPKSFRTSYLDPMKRLEKIKRKITTKKQNIHKLHNAEGFLRRKEYNFDEYRNMARKWKKDWEKKHGGVKWTDEERETIYWKSVDERTPKLKVEYGNDVDGLEVSSFFETSDDEEKLHPWNLNSLPLNEKGIFRALPERIPGLTHPWLYFGMQFATFCWHNEDNWMYSTSFLHMGANKTWYGIPGDHAEKMEHVMKKLFPVQFSEKKNLMFRLVTMVNPAILKEHGIPVCRARQEPGQFIVTYPKAFHAGFSNGFNCAEAVNFADFDWIKHGKDADKLYRQVPRNSCLSMDRLILSIIKHDLVPSGEWKRVRSFLKSIIDDEIDARAVVAKKIKAKRFFRGIRREIKECETLEQAFDLNRHMDTLKSSSSSSSTPSSSSSSSTPSSSSTTPSSSSSSCSNLPSSSSTTPSSSSSTTPSSSSSTTPSSSSVSLSPYDVARKFGAGPPSTNTRSRSKMEIDDGPKVVGMKGAKNVVKSGKEEALQDEDHIRAKSLNLDGDKGQNAFKTLECSECKEYLFMSFVRCATCKAVTCLRHYESIYRNHGGADRGKEKCRGQLVRYKRHSKEELKAYLKYVDQRITQESE